MSHSLHQNKPLGSQVHHLICLVPIQIICVENIGLQPLLDGLQIPPDLKVVSSMGKQSSGKSYFLNHLSGSLLDVVGGRCTNGVWIKVWMDSKFLYVLMDFEGLVSFERTKQEDMLFSILNDALSSFPIFNKKVCFENYLNSLVCWFQIMIFQFPHLQFYINLVSQI